MCLGCLGIDCTGMVLIYNASTMGRSRRASVEKYHDRVAARYDQSYTDGYWQWRNALTWDYLKPFLPRDANAQVVDLGCGTGTWGAKLDKSGYRVTSVDISRQMLDQASRKIEEEVEGSPARFVRADLCDLSELPKDTYSMAIALGDPIGCTRSPIKAMKQIRRILREDGTLVATFDNRLAALDFYLQAGDRQAMARFLRDGKTHWFTRDVEEQFPIFTFTPSGIRKLVARSGFSVIEMVGVTVLPMRHYRGLLTSAEDRRAWAKTEKTLCRDEAAMGRASHLQVVCRPASA